MRSNLQVFEEVIEFHATKAYLNLRLTKVHNNNNITATGTISESLRQ